MKKRIRLERGSYIGGHDAVAILGKHPYKGAGDVYASMVNGYRPDIGDNPKVRRGNICEPGLLDLTEKERGHIKRDLHIVDVNGFFAGTLDAVEVKTGIIHDVTVTDTRSNAWVGGLAQYKVLQLLHYQGIAEHVDYCISKNGLVMEGWPYPVADHSILTVMYADTGDIVHHVVWKDDDIIKELRDTSIAFLANHVDKKIPPAAVSDDAAKHVWPVDNGEMIEPDDLFISAAKQYIDARDLAKQWAESKKKCSAILRNHIGSNVGCRWEVGNEVGNVSWKTSKGRTVVDHQQMSRDLCDKLDLGYTELCERYKKQKPGARTLRVNIKGEEA